MEKISRLILLAAVLLVACKKNGGVKPAPPQGENPNRRIVVLYTNDERGWMEPTDSTGGAAGLVGLWKEKEGCTPEGPYLLSMRLQVSAASA